MTWCVIANGRLSHNRGLSTPAGKGITGLAMQTGQLYLTQDYVNDPYASRVNVVGNFQAMACAPLITRGQAIGVLTIARRGRAYLQ